MNPRPDCRCLKEPLAKQGGSLRSPRTSPLFKAFSGNGRKALQVAFLFQTFPMHLKNLFARPMVLPSASLGNPPSGKSLTIHLGMPKTGTTALQRVMSTAGPALAERGFDYPSGFRDKGGIAHHPIAHEINNRRDLKGPNVCEFLAHLDTAASDHVVISSEAFTNALSPAVLKTFVKFVDECNARMPTKLVISLRQIDSFMESMYLHSVKVGALASDMGAYVGERGNWARSLFRGLTAVRERPGGIRMEIVKYEATDGFFGRFFDAMGLPYREMAELSSVPRENIRLGLKAQTLLRHFDHFADRMGMEIHRQSLVNALAGGRLQFDEDVYSYRLLSFADADRLHSQALEASLATGFHEYEQFFGTGKIAARDSVTLAPSNVTEADILKLKAHFQGC